MPVHLDSYDPDLELTPDTTRSDIVVFLYRNAQFGFRPTEVRDALDIPRGTVTTTLKRLYDDDLVGKTGDGHYHALSHRDDLQRYVASHEQCARMFADRPPAAVDDDMIDHEQISDAELDAEADALEADLEDEFGE